MPAFIDEFYPYLPNLAAFALVDNSDAIDNLYWICRQNTPFLRCAAASNPKSHARAKCTWGLQEEQPKGVLQVCYRIFSTLSGCSPRKWWDVTDLNRGPKDYEKRHSKNLQCLRRLAGSCLRCVSKCVSSVALQRKLQLFALLVLLPTNTYHT